MSSYFTEEKADPKWEQQRLQEQQRRPAIHPVGAPVRQSKSAFDEAGPLPYFVLGAGCLACGAFGARGVVRGLQRAGFRLPEGSVGMRFKGEGERLLEIQKARGPKTGPDRV